MINLGAGSRLLTIFAAAAVLLISMPWPLFCHKAIGCISNVKNGLRYALVFPHIRVISYNSPEGISPKAIFLA